MEMVGAIFRDKYAEKDAQDGRTTYHIAIMPCTAKKMEAARPEFIHDGRPDVDLVLTTHEVIDMMQEAGIQLNELELESPDLPFGLGSGAAVIYGTTGGVAEAVDQHSRPARRRADQGDDGHHRGYRAEARGGQRSCQRKKAAQKN